MRSSTLLVPALAILLAGPARAQRSKPGPTPGLTVIKAARMLDVARGLVVPNPVVLIEGD